MAIDGPLKLNVQIVRGSTPAIGPGKAIVLRAIDREGSIAAAGRTLGMSYRRIWLLVDAMNGDWAEPVVETRIGGGRLRGAALTAFGRELLDHYGSMETAMMRAAHGASLDWLVGAIRPLD